MQPSLPSITIVGEDKRSAFRITSGQGVSEGEELTTGRVSRTGDASALTNSDNRAGDAALASQNPVQSSRTGDASALINSDNRTGGLQHLLPKTLFNPVGLVMPLY